VARADAFAEEYGYGELECENPENDQRGLHALLF
jgi:hypothetical protein